MDSSISSASDHDAHPPPPPEGQRHSAPIPLDFTDAESSANGSVTVQLSVEEGEVGPGEVRVSIEPGSDAAVEPSRRRTGSELEPEAAPSSPSSSGYAAERGSSTSDTSGSAIEREIEEEMRIEVDDNTLRGISDSQTTWIAGKRHLDEV